MTAVKPLALLGVVSLGAPAASRKWSAHVGQSDQRVKPGVTRMKRSHGSQSGTECAWVIAGRYWTRRLGDDNDLR
jgi:hypothetical protein